MSEAYNRTYVGMTPLNTAKRMACGIAKDLHYGPEVIKKINLAKNENEITAILKSARDGIK